MEPVTSHPSPSSPVSAALSKLFDWEQELLHRLINQHWDHIEPLLDSIAADFQQRTEPGSEALSRFGYDVLTSPHKRTVAARPALLEHLAYALLLQQRAAEHSPMAGTPDEDLRRFRRPRQALWMLDLALDYQLQTHAPLEAVLARYEAAPGRRLLSLKLEASLEPLIESLKSSVEAIPAAVGIDRLRIGPSETLPQAWRQLHVPFPWRLETLRQDFTVPQALQALEQPDNPWQRGASLYLLLHRASTNSDYTQDEIGLDLKRELIVPMTAAFATTQGSTREEEEASQRLRWHTGASLNIARLLLASGLAEEVHVWQVTTWVKQLLLRSPFVPADAALLSLQAAAALSERVQPPSSLMDPWALAVDGDGCHPDELSLLLALYLHLTESSQAKRPPYTLPDQTLSFVRRIANRPLNSGEQAYLILQRRLVQGTTEADRQKAFPPLTTPLAPPLLARRILQEEGGRWLERLQTDAFEETLQWASNQAQSDGLNTILWVLRAIHRESTQLSAARLESSAQHFKEWLKWLPTSDSVDPSISGEVLPRLLLVGLAVYEHLTPTLRETLVTAFGQAELGWRPGLLSTWARACARVQAQEDWQRALEGLVELAMELHHPAQVRLDAAFLLVRLFHQPTLPMAESIRLQLLKAVARAPLADNPDLRREMRRNGLIQ